MKGNLFIKRPVMAFSVSILILIIGFISLYTLPVEQYPDIAPPTVMVSANYTGADAEAVMNAVVMPLEESINGVENMMYMNSTATNSGSATIQVYFKQGTDPDMAAGRGADKVCCRQRRHVLVSLLKSVRPVSCRSIHWPVRMVCSTRPSCPTIWTLTSSLV